MRAKQQRFIKIFHISVNLRLKLEHVVQALALIMGLEERSCAILNATTLLLMRFLVLLKIENLGRAQISFVLCLWPVAGGWWPFPALCD